MKNEISDCSSLSKLQGLALLYLSDNKIKNFSFLSELKSLIWLDLRNNKISDFSFSSKLKDLTSLNLSNNIIREVPQQLATGRMEIKIGNEYDSNCINLTDNPIEAPP